MLLRWETVEKWRLERPLSKADLARMMGGSESTIHRGLKHNSKLQGTTLTAIRTIFPEKFDAKGEPLQ